MQRFGHQPLLELVLQFVPFRQQIILVLQLGQQFKLLLVLLEQHLLQPLLVLKPGPILLVIIGLRQ